MIETASDKLKQNENCIGMILRKLRKLKKMF